MADVPERLDSWKAIADYLGRDVRTLRRWEAQGLPVRRVSGGRGSSVFAFRHEIDEWLKSAQAPLPPQAPAAAPAIAQAAPLRSRPRRIPRRAIAAGLVFAATIIGWKTFAPSAAPEQLTVAVSTHGITASNSSGAVLWQHDFAAGEDNVLSTMSTPWFVARGMRPGVFAMTSYREMLSDKSRRSGQLLQLSLDGTVEHTFEMQDRWSFAGTTYEGPWALTDFRVDDSFGRRQIAVSAHHYTWWPSVVTILDERFQRLGTFVNGGWVDNLRWLSPDRLAISGFNEALDGGMLGVLDAHDVDGSSPEAKGSKFECTDCRSGRPEKYFVFPRSELNRVTGSRFNRTFIDVVGDAVTAHSDEVARPDDRGGMVEAVYEFTTQVDLVRASYGSRYWDKHRALEMEGKITHTREQCPERDGPPLVKMWTRETGWTDIHPKR